SGPDRRGGGARRGGRGPAGRAQHRARRQCGHGPRQFPHRPPRPAGGAGRARRARPRGAVRAGRGVAAGGRGDAPVPRRAADRGLDGGRVPSHRRDRGGSGLAGRRWGDPGPRRAGGAPRREADGVTAALLLAGAVLAWPGNAAVARLRLLHEPGDRPAGLRRWLDGVPVSVLAPAAAGVAALLVAGPLQAAAAALLALTVADLRRRAAVRRGRLVRLGAWERALDDAISALTSGAGPEQALARASAAAVGDRRVASILHTARSHARLGGDVTAALRAQGDPAATDLASAWQLATRHGGVLADVVDGLRADVAARRERAVRVDAALAGPRATAVILTALPALGALLGSGFGADPLAVLRGGPVGGVLCLVGAGFLCAGLAWTDRIVEGASR